MNKLKLLFFFTIAMLVCALIGVGCSSLLTTPASPSSLPVQLGVATTNDVQLVALEDLIRSVNANLNPTPTREPIDTIMGAIIALTSGLAGWLGRHKATPSAKSDS